MADRKCCDICGGIVEGRPIIRSEKTTHEFSVCVKGYFDNRSRQFDICQNCFKKIEWHHYSFEDGHRYEPALGGFFNHE